MSKKSNRITPDWEGIEREYRAGSLSIVEIAKNFGTLESSIRMRAKRKGWTRDLAAKVRQRVREKIVRTDVRQTPARTSEIGESHIVEVASDRGAHIVRNHLAMAHRLTGIAEWNLKALEAIQSGKLPPFEIVLGKSDGLTALMRTTADLIDRVVNLERRALSLDEVKPQRDAPIKFEVSFSPPPTDRIIPGPPPADPVAAATPVSAVFELEPADEDGQS